MSLFRFDPSRALTTLPHALPARPCGGAPRLRGEMRGLPGESGGSLFDLGGNDPRVAASPDDLDDQFVVYQLNSQPDGPALLDASAVKPSLAGSAEQPDVLARLNLVSFHIGSGEGIEEDTRATMRLTLGADPDASGRVLDATFWAVAAGLKLFQDGGVAQDRQLASDLNRAFANRPIEIQGGLGLLNIEVVRHREPKWWQKLFHFALGPTGQALTGVLGFPALILPALSLVDELLNRLGEDKPEILFRSSPMRLALSQRAHDDFTGGNPRIRLGSLADGYCVMVRGRDRDEIVAADPVFYPTHGVLAPASADPARTETLMEKNPLHGLTYAVFRVHTRSTMLDPDFAFRR